MLVDLIKANAKAIAVPVTALVLWAVRALADNAGVTVVIDNDEAVKVVATAIIAVVVWFARNKPKNALPPPAPE
jgi:hypothetical protein